MLVKTTHFYPNNICCKIYNITTLNLPTFPQSFPQLFPFSLMYAVLCTAWLARPLCQLHYEETTPSNNSHSRFRTQATYAEILAHSTIKVRAATSGQAGLAQPRTLGTWTSVASTLGQRSTTIRRTAFLSTTSPKKQTPPPYSHSRFRTQGALVELVEQIRFGVHVVLFGPMSPFLLLAPIASIFTKVATSFWSLMT